MLSLFDIMARAQDGAGLETLAGQFGLSLDETHTALEVLLPAFSQGLKRRTADPSTTGALMSAIASGQHARYFDQPAQAALPEGLALGNGALMILFGSVSLSRAVTAQAARITGIGQGVLDGMLPVIAAMLMGGLFRQSAGQLGQPADAGMDTSFGGLMQHTMHHGTMTGLMGGAMMPGTHPAQHAGQNPFDNPLGQMFEGMFGGAATRPQGQRPANDTDRHFGRSLGRMMEEMARGSTGTGPERTDPPPANTDRSPPNPYDDVFAQMFEAVGKADVKAHGTMASLFDHLLKGVDKPVVDKRVVDRGAIDRGGDDKD